MSEGVVVGKMDTNAYESTTTTDTTRSDDINMNNSC